MVAAGVLGAGLLLATPAGATGHCQYVFGTFHSEPASPCASPVGFCTGGVLWGGLWGTYAFVMKTASSAGDETVPGVMFYTGKSVITLDSGATLTGTDTGTVDLDPTGTHAMAAILTLTGGTAEMAGKVGHLILRGRLDLESGEVDGDYFGKVCTP